MNKNFDWRIDAENYLSNKFGDKIKVKDFINKICSLLDNYKKETWQNIRNVKHNHPCADLGKKKSKQAKN